MKSKSLILMFVSLGFGLIAAIGISQVMGRGGPGGAEVRTSQVLVAADFIEINKELTEEVVRLEEWPVNIIPENVIRDLKQIQNMSTVRAIPRGAPIFASDIIDKNKQSNINLKDGQRVIFIKVGPESTGHGLLKPGDRVDIIGSFSQGYGQNANTVASTFLKNIEVYSVNETTERKGPREATAAKPNSIVGVILNQKQAEKVALVQKVGTLTFTIRGQESVSGEPEVEDPLPSWLDPTKTAEGEQQQNISHESKPQNEVTSKMAAFLETIKNNMQTERRQIMRVYHGKEVQVFRVNPDGSLTEDDSLEDSKDTKVRRHTDIDFNMPFGKSDPNQNTGSQSQPPAMETEPDEYSGAGKG